MATPGKLTTRNWPLLPGKRCTTPVMPSKGPSMIFTSLPLAMWSSSGLKYVSCAPSTSFTRWKLSMSRSRTCTYFTVPSFMVCRFKKK